MNKDRLIEVSLLIVIIVGLAYLFTKQQSSSSQDNSNEVITIIGDEIVSESSSKTTNKTEPEKGQGRLITQYVSVESNNQAALPYVSYRFQPPFLPLGRLLDFRHIDDAFWFAGNTGLLRFDLMNEQWSFFDKKNGLPGDTAYDVAIANGELVMEVYNWSKDRSLSKVGNFRFFEGRFLPLKGSIESAEIGGYVSSKSVGLAGSIKDIVKHKNKYVLLSFMGKHSREKGFQGGGVAQLTPTLELLKTHTTDDGIAHPYAYTMTIMAEGSLWLSHFHEERGLSVIYPGASSWVNIKQSENGIDLGGVRLGSINHILVIGQQGGLVFYDTISKQAYLFNEAMGLPGYIVSGIQVIDEHVWVAAYSYAKGGKQQRATGLIKFHFQDLAALFR